MSESLEMLYEQIDDLTDQVGQEQDRADENERLVCNLFHAYHDADQQEANRMWNDEPTLQALLPERDFKREPGSCLFEISCIDGKKSECVAYGHWTNCREVNHCMIGADDE